jgi:colanic acid biosynthesis glycosyl transferase WcaI
MLEEARVLGLTNLLMLPFQPRERLCEVQSSADLMLLTVAPNVGASSVPSKLITYLAVGKPVVCAAAPDTDVARLVRETGVGQVVDPGSPHALADAIRSMRTRSTAELESMGRRAREFALQDHSLDNALKRFDRLFAELGLIPSIAPTEETRRARAADQQSFEPGRQESLR